MPSTGMGNNKAEKKKRKENRSYIGMNRVLITYYAVLHMWPYPCPSEGGGACNVDRASEPNDAMDIIGPLGTYF